MNEDLMYIIKADAIDIVEHSSDHHRRVFVLHDTISIRRENVVRLLFISTDDAYDGQFLFRSSVSHPISDGYVVDSVDSMSCDIDRSS
jgi:hypothetical protein